MKLLKSLYFWIIIAFISGSLFGYLNPKLAELMQPLGTNFIKLIKIFIGPIIFLTIATGIAQTGSLKKLGRIGLKAFIYFEIVSTIALLIGWSAGLIFKPGTKIAAHLNQLDSTAVNQFLISAEKLSFLQFMENLIPNNLFEPFIKGDLLQILVIAILFGISLLLIGEHHAKNITRLMTSLTESLFKIIRLIMYTAPLGVFGAMSFTVAKFGSQFLIPLISLMATFYFAGLIFVIFILVTIAKLAGFSLLQLLKYLLPELLLVLGTSSSESALPQLIYKLEKLGCQPETVGIVVPMGYSFNLDGTNIYITLAALFIAQALGIHLTFTEQLILFATAMLSSKGAAGVTGAGFITLAATLTVVPSIPPIGIVLILGIDRFMSEARSLINFIGNSVAALTISRSEQEMSAHDLNKLLLSEKDLK